MEIKNFAWHMSDEKRNNSEFFPRHIKGLIIGRTGCGKTIFLLNCLLCPNWLDYDHLYVYCTSMEQTEYQILKAAFEYGLTKEAVYALFVKQDVIRKKGFETEQLFEEMKELFPTGTKIKAEFEENVKDVPDPHTFSRRNKNIAIFDDIMLEKQDNIEKFYTQGRHYNIDCFYLAQSYYKILRGTIRGNMNFLCLFEQPGQNLTKIHKDFAEGDMTIKEFKDFCNKCWKTRHNFVVIDLERNKDEGRYRCNLDEYYIPSKY